MHMPDIKVIGQSVENYIGNGLTRPIALLISSSDNGADSIPSNITPCLSYMLTSIILINNASKG